VIYNVEFPVFVNVVGAGGLQPAMDPLRQNKVMELGMKDAVVIWAPMPLREAVWGLPGASSVIERVPLKLPEEEGVKDTLMVQLAPEARVEPQVLVWAKLALAAMLEMFSGAVP
jgi:hypothetical protein